jgi:hypothetical protein
MSITVFGVELDDFTREENDDRMTVWTQVCDKHLKDFPDCTHDIGSGHGICGVKGCLKESEHYIDFDETDIESEE